MRLEICSRRLRARLDEEDVLPLVVGDIHAARAVEADAAADAAIGQARELFGFRRTGLQLADGTLAPEVDHVQSAGGIDGRPLDAGGIIGRSDRRDYGADEQRVVGARGCRCQNRGEQTSAAKRAHERGSISTTRLPFHRCDSRHLQH
jgi:hypothetical protein